MQIKPIRLLSFISVTLFALLILSGANSYDQTTWLMEVFPIFIALPLMWGSIKRFPLTTLLYCLILAHAVVLIIGGTYTYARVPFGFEIQNYFGLSRNPYDKVGHFFQGFVPLLAAREILIRGNFVKGKKMLSFVVLCIVLAISAVYELIEWAAAISIGQDADAFLGTQGDPWDTQSDMFFALVGAMTSLVCLTRYHDQQIKKVQLKQTYE